MIEQYVVLSTTRLVKAYQLLTYQAIQRAVLDHHWIIRACQKSKRAIKRMYYTQCLTGILTEGLKAWANIERGLFPASNFVLQLV